MSDLVSTIRAAARYCGYAVAVHGSEQRDLDLIAAPWTAEATDAATLIENICTEAALHPQPDHPDHPNPEYKPHGRVGWALAGVADYAYIDLSVMPRGEPLAIDFATAVRLPTGDRRR